MPAHNPDSATQQQVALSSVSLPEAATCADSEESEKYYQELIHSLNAIIWEGLPEKFRYVFVSPQAEQILGYPVERWLAGDGLEFWTALIHPLDRERVGNFTRTELEAGRDHQIEYRANAADGRVVWLQGIVYLQKDAAGRVRRLRGLMVDITERKQAEENIKASEVRLRRQNAAIADLARRGVYYREDFDAAIKEITETASRTLDIERVSIWLFNDEQTQINCIDLYERGDDRHCEGIVLTEADCPAYFEEIRGVRVLAAHEACIDERTKGFTEKYLKPLGIGSMMDAPVRLGGRTIGIVCHEHKGAMRQWALDEQQFAASIGDLTSLALEARAHRRADKALRESEERYRELFENANDIHYMIDLAGNLTSINKAGENISGYTRDELLRMNISQLVASDHLQNSRRLFVDTLRAGASAEIYEIEIIAKNGRRVLLEVSNRLLSHKDRPAGLQGIARDVTERWTAREALRESEERYALAAVGANDGLWDWNLKRHHIFFSPRWKAMLGYAEDEIGNRPEEWFERLHPDDLDKVKMELNAHLEGNAARFKNEHRMRHKDGTYRWMLARGIAVRDAAGWATRMAGSQTDITQRHRVEDQLLHDAFHDAMTGLPNRPLFLDHLSLVIEQSARRPGHLFAVLFLDLDQFKIINDSLGHVPGDQLLVEISSRLKNCLRPGDTVARLGGDEFAILLHELSEPADATRIAERIHQELRQPFEIDGNEVFATVSVGIALNTIGLNRPEDFLRAADTAMYRAKALGRARHQVFDQAMHSRALRLLQLENDLRRAVERRELCVHYQPIISLESWQITSFEALVRWQHPERGMIYPVNFIPIAEETGLIVPLGLLVLEEACRQTRHWQERFPMEPPLCISVNLSGKQFAQPDLIEDIKGILAATDFDPCCLKLEITESVVMENPESTAAMLQQLRGIGVQLNIDDFGTGYSSLSYLQRFPINSLKVDRSFISSMSGRDENSEIVRTIITLAHTLGMDVVAEGVETPEQLSQLRALHCGSAQGNLFSPALSAAAAEQLLAATRSGELLVKTAAHMS
ncbi:MAG: EAL domain-containing protein [Pyrinomonadaceae bacterium]